MKRREAKSKGEKERYTHLNAEFQIIARRDKKAFFSDQYQAPLPMGFSRLQQGTSITHHVDLFTGLLERLVGWPLAPQSECPRESMVTTSLMP